jgi:hypothetical protein
MSNEQIKIWEKADINNVLKRTILTVPWRILNGTTNSPVTLANNGSTYLQVQKSRTVLTCLVSAQCIRDISNVSRWLGFHNSFYEFVW